MVEKTKLLKIQKTKLANLKESLNGFNDSANQLRESVEKYKHLISHISNLQSVSTSSVSVQDTLIRYDDILGSIQTGYDVNCTISLLIYRTCIGIRTWTTQ